MRCHLSKTRCSPGPRVPLLSLGTSYCSGKLRHLVASRSWRLTDHPPTRFPILHGSLSAGPPLVLSRAPQSAGKGYPSGVSTSTSTEKTAFPWLRYSQHCSTDFCNFVLSSASFHHSPRIGSPRVSAQLSSL